MPSSPPSPLSPLTIKFVLKLISPPSNLSSPLPSHLLSGPLLQRHHFLNISPDDPASYLSWPSDHQHRVLHILETEFEDLTADTPTFEPLIRYTSDSESVHAHVHVAGEPSSGLRLVFQWSPDESSWKYHDASLMPFPPSTYDSPHSALEFLQEPDVQFDAKQDDEDDYWDSYGQDVDEDEQQSHPKIQSADKLSAEDAYWAQYSAIQGSGDSTQPSPVRAKRKLQPVDSSTGESEENVVTFSRPELHLRTATSKLDPPSPRTLSARLSDMSPRSPPPFLAPDDIASPLDDSTVMDSPSPSGLGHVAPKSLLLQEEEKGESRPDSADDALKSSIKGLYALWRAGRDDTQQLRDNFLDVVRSSL